MRRIAVVALCLGVVWAGPAAAQTGPTRVARSEAGASEPVTTGSLGQPGAALVGEREASPASFSAFVAGLWPAARARGVSRATFDAAFSGVTSDPKIVELTRRQSEFVKPIWSYLEGAVSEARVARGRSVAAEHASTLAAIERRYGVERSVILGVWGMETNYGSFTGGKDVIRSLATLAHLRYRGAFFRDELLTALTILQQGHVARADMKGSWAGAMGQTQFMPSSFRRWAVDQDGDGHKDIWTSIPDALASTANYLKAHGWRRGLPWSVEVRLPARFDYKTRKAAFSRWAALGAKRADGKPMPNAGEGSLFLPAGAHGPAFLVTANFTAIKAYNSSDAYAMGVGLLGDRIGGASGVQAAWPVGEPQLDHAQRREIQRRLASMGFDIGEADGRIGTRTRDALRAFQERRGLVPDGHPTVGALQALRTAR
ncbi:lytic murein transglycosylase [Alsobacter sp. KACC 23698]|uniref:Lytic murein transglycosylase n=1 Tax=Alsobacter sp. KACC 23698 TaxID=3149229 RepID=A0AAU7JCJ9_9HYPH